MVPVAVKKNWLLVLLTLAALSPGHAATSTLQGLIDAVVRNGPASQVPAHLAVVLGLSAIEQSVPVKQAVMRAGTVVRTFNVAVARHEDVVLMAYDESSRSMKVYLVSAAGELRKAVSYQAGAPAIERSLADARNDFAGEVQFWKDFQQKAATAP
jgi:hypothetical protein